MFLHAWDGFSPFHDNVASSDDLLYVFILFFIAAVIFVSVDEFFLRRSWTCDYDDFWIPVSSFWCVFYLTVEFVTIEDAKEVSEFDLVFSEVFDDGDELLEEAVEPFK